MACRPTAFRPRHRLACRRGQPTAANASGRHRVNIKSPLPCRAVRLAIVLAVSLLRPGLLPCCQTARGALPYGPFGNIKRAVRQDRTARIAPRHNRQPPAHPLASGQVAACRHGHGSTARAHVAGAARLAPCCLAAPGGVASGLGRRAAVGFGWRRNGRCGTLHYRRCKNSSPYSWQFAEEMLSLCNSLCTIGRVLTTPCASHGFKENKSKY